MAKRKKKEQPLLPYNDFRYDTSVEYRTEIHHYNTDECDSICRCGTLEDIRVDEVYFGNIFHAFLTEKSKENPYYMYALDRLLRIHGAHLPENYTAYKTCGYYGEEIKDVKFEGFDQLSKDLETAFAMTDLKLLMEFLLTVEYGAVLERLKNVKWSIEHIKYSELKIGNESYARKIKPDEIYEYTTLDGELPIGVYYKAKNSDHYVLVDGYHRYLKLVTASPTKVNIVVAEEK